MYEPIALVSSCPPCGIRTIWRRSSPRCRRTQTGSSPPTRTTWDRPWRRAPACASARPSRSWRISHAPMSAVRPAEPAWVAFAARPNRGQPPPCAWRGNPAHAPRTVTWVSTPVEGDGAAPTTLPTHLRCAHDDADRRIGLALPDGQQQSWGYDPAGRVNGVIQPGGGSWTVAHDGAGQPTMAGRPTSADARADHAVLVRRAPVLCTGAGCRPPTLY